MEFADTGSYSMTQMSFQRRRSENEQRIKCCFSGILSNSFTQLYAPAYYWFLQNSYQSYTWDSIEDLNPAAV